MHLSSILTLTSLAALAAADCVILTGNQLTYKTQLEFTKASGVVCANIKGRAGVPCLRRSDNLYRRVCHAVPPMTGVTIWNTPLTHDTRSGDNCNPAANEGECRALAGF